MKKFLVIIHCLFFTTIINAQRVGIGTTNPDASAQLDVSASDKGMLVPRLALTAANSASPVSAPADALLIFNTATAGSSDNAVSPGFYYWSTSSSRWIPISKPASVASAGDVGFGSWGDCSVTAISEYQPAVSNDGRDGDLFGITVGISGNSAIAASIFDTVGANGHQGSAYIFSFNGTNWVQQQKLVATDGAADDLLGYSVAVAGNYAVVGAPFKNGQGAAYVFFYNGNAWVQQQKLMASDGAVDDHFGLAVAINGDNVLVGARDRNTGGNSDQGGAYIFHRNGTVWTQLPVLTANDGHSGAQFGTSVALSGNYAVVGAPTDNAEGAAYVFFYNGSNWIQQQKLTNNDVNTEYLGGSVSISGNYIITGAETSTVGTNNAQGLAFIFFNNGSNWEQQTQLFAADGGYNDRFGGRVSISGNYALVAAEQATVGTSVEQGVTYLYQNAGGFWIRKQKITNPSGGPSDFSGTCAISNGRFIIGNGNFSLKRGQVLFGKVN